MINVKFTHPTCSGTLGFFPYFLKICSFPLPCNEWEHPVLKTWSVDSWEFPTPFQSLIEYRKLTDFVSDSTLQLNFKKLLVKFWCSIKEYSHLSEKATKILLPLQLSMWSQISFLYFKQNMSQQTDCRSRREKSAVFY